MRERSGLEVLTAEVKRSSIFWNIRPWRPLKISGNFGGNCASIFRVEERAKQEVSMKQVTSTVHVGFLNCLFFDPDDGGDMFLRKVG
jgi:hypothetical protein